MKRTITFIKEKPNEYDHNTFTVNPCNKCKNFDCKKSCTSPKRARYSQKEESNYPPTIEEPKSIIGNINPSIIDGTDTSIIRNILEKYHVDMESLTNDNKRPIHLACSLTRTRIVKYLVDGFFDGSNKIYDIRPKVNLNCVDLYQRKPIDYLTDEKSKSKRKLSKYIKEKMEITKRTIFRSIPVVFQNIIFI